MKNVIITIECDNAAFEGNPAIETARILKKLADRMTCEDDMIGLNGLSLYDINGNNVGFIDVNAE